MPKKTDSGGRKRRTREHIIADLSVNHVERFVLRNGHTVERIRYDYGLDLAMVTFDSAGELENGLVWLQLKATDRLRRTSDGQAVVIRVERAHLVHWINEMLPVILVVYDAKLDRAYWLDLKAEFGRGRIFQVQRQAETLTLHLPLANVVDDKFVRHLARMKNKLLTRWAKGELP